MITILSILLVQNYRGNMSKKILNKEKAIEDFNEFLFFIDEWLDTFIAKVDVQGFTLDFSLDSLKDLAKYIRDNNIVNDRKNIEDFANCWIYLGEVFRRHAEGAYWDIGLENNKYANYGLYFLTGYDKEMSEFIPILYLNNFTLFSKEDQSNNFFYDLIEFELNPIIPDLDYLPTEKD